MEKKIILFGNLLREIAEDPCGTDPEDVELFAAAAAVIKEQEICDRFYAAYLFCGREDEKFYHCMYNAEVALEEGDFSYANGLLKSFGF